MSLDIKSVIERLAVELVQEAPPLSARQAGRLRAILSAVETLEEEKAA